MTFYKRYDTYSSRQLDLHKQLKDLDYILATNPFVVKNNLYCQEEDEDKSNENNNNLHKHYMPKYDISTENGSLSDIITHLKPLKDKILARRQEYINEGILLKKGVRVNDALVSIWKDIVRFAFSKLNNGSSLIESVTKKLVTEWKEMINNIQKFSSFKNLTEKRNVSIVILLNIIDRIINAHMTYSNNFIRDATLCRLISWELNAIYNKNEETIKKEMEYLSLCNKQNIELPLIPSLLTGTKYIEAQIKGVYIYGNFNPQSNVDQCTIVEDIYSDYMLKLIFEFLLSPHIHETWQEVFFVSFISILLKLVKKHKPYILALGQQLSTMECDEDHSSNDYCKSFLYGNNNNVMFKRGCHPFIFLPIAADFWSFCKNGKPLYDINKIIVNKHPSSFPLVCGGPAGVAQGKQLLWENFCKSRGISSCDCTCFFCDKRKVLVDRVRRRIGHIAGNTDIRDIKRWHQGNILMICFYPFTGLWANSKYASDRDDNADFFKTLITALDKSQNIRNNYKLISGEYNNNRTYHMLAFGINEEYENKIKGTQKKNIKIIISVDDDILEGERISEIQLITLHKRNDTELICWFSE
uniref:Wsv427-like protein n=1 Tax=Trachysalambria curvirostris majanivirus TaxID=2984281 RepID=A0A9C7C019_9VIRU|nr:MAG: wsv427-like protein [Trachysalambria curvirostris majanivirus]